MAVGLTIGLFFGILVLGGLLVSAFIPLSWLFFVSAALATAQMYLIPAGGVTLPLATVAALGMWRALDLGLILRTPVLLAGLCLILVQLVSIAWSPNPVLGVRLVIYSAPFFLLVSIVGAKGKYPGLLSKALIFGLGLTVIQPILVIIFRFLPALKLKFLASPVSKFFIPGGVSEELFSSAYSIMDPSKSGGLFVNANVGAMYLGVCGCLALGFSGALKAPWLRYVAYLNFLAVPFAGSKAAILILMLLALTALVYSLIQRGGASLGAITAASFLLLLAIPSLFVGYYLLSNSVLAEASLSTLESRFPMWGFAWQVLTTQPLTGLGFGGWELEWPRYALENGLNPVYPPHNSLLNYFVQSGFFAVLAALAFVSLLFLYGFKVARNGGDEMKSCGLGLMAAVFWFFTQSMGENYGYLGEVHLTIMLGSSMAWLIANFVQPGVTTASDA